MAKSVRKKGYVGFDKLQGELAHRKGVYDPAGLARYIGERKYGKGRFNAAARGGIKLRGERPGGKRNPRTPPLPPVGTKPYPSSRRPKMGPDSTKFHY